MFNIYHTLIFWPSFAFLEIYVRKAFSAFSLISFLSLLNHEQRGYQHLFSARMGCNVIWWLALKIKCVAFSVYAGKLMPSHNPAFVSKIEWLLCAVLLYIPIPHQFLPFREHDKCRQDNLLRFCFLSLICFISALLAHLVWRTIWHLFPVSNGGVVGRFASHLHSLIIFFSCPHPLALPVLSLGAYGAAVANICFQNRNEKKHWWRVARTNFLHSKT